MKTNYLLPHKYKRIGWVLFVLGLIAGGYMILTGYEQDVLNMTVFSIHSDDAIFGEAKGFFQLVENDILDELIAVFIIVGGLFISFSRERIEDEFVYKLRKDSLVWAVIFNYIVLLLAVLFVYGFTFFDVLVFNMFTPLIFFVFRFHFMKYKSQSHEE
ncbi:MAG: hypothetical protein AAF466_06650 [Bacteroidota bacterium]